MAEKNIPPKKIAEYEKKLLETTQKIAKLLEKFGDRIGAPPAPPIKNKDDPTS